MATSETDAPPTDTASDPADTDGRSPGIEADPVRDALRIDGIRGVY